MWPVRTLSEDDRERKFPCDTSEEAEAFTRPRSRREEGVL